MNTYNIDKMYENYSSEIEKMQKCIDELHQENNILKENAENNDKVVDKVNWKNQLLKKENKQLKEELKEYKNPIKYFKYANKNVVEENKLLKDNWNKLKEYINKENENLYWANNYDDILYVMHKLENGDKE